MQLMSLQKIVMKIGKSVDTALKAKDSERLFYLHPPCSANPAFTDTSYNFAVSYSVVFRTLFHHDIRQDYQ